MSLGSNATGFMVAITCALLLRASPAQANATRGLKVIAVDSASKTA